MNAMKPNPLIAITLSRHLSPYDIDMNVRTGMFGTVT